MIKWPIRTCLLRSNYPPHIAASWEWLKVDPGLISNITTPPHLLVNDISCSATVTCFIRSSSKTLPVSYFVSSGMSLPLEFLPNQVPLLLPQSDFFPRWPGVRCDWLFKEETQSNFRSFLSAGHMTVSGIMDFSADPAFSSLLVVFT